MVVDFKKFGWKVSDDMIKFTDKDDIVKVMGEVVDETTFHKIMRSAYMLTLNDWENRPLGW